MINKFLLLGICSASLALIPAAKADFSFDFNSSTPSPGSNFAPQDGWSTNVATESVSYLGAVAGYGQSVFLGGLTLPDGVDPATSAYTLNHGVNEALAGKTFSIDFSIFNRATTGTPLDFDNTDFDDSFTINLEGSGGFAYEFTITPPAVEDNTRNISMTGSATTGVIIAGDLASLNIYNLSITFAANGADLDYTAKILGSTSATFSGTLAGQAGTTLENIGAGWNITDPNIVDNYGYNSLMIDNISLVTVPESSVGMLGLLAVGAMGLRRRR